MGDSLFGTLSRCRTLGSRLERPTLDMMMTEGEWELFRDHWQEFKFRNNLEEAEALMQLVLCARGVIARKHARRCSTEEELLFKLKERAVKEKQTFRTVEIFLDPEVKAKFQSRCLSYWSDAFSRSQSEEFDEMR